jgi:signal transduction histidine kinase
MAAEPIRALLVEDNPADARLLCEHLRESAAGAFEVTRVARLSACIEQLRQNPFDVVLLDLTLPDSRSIDTVRRVHAEAAEVPIVVLTGLEDEAVGVEAVRQGAQDYLVKGQTDPRLLARSIRYAIERNRAEMALALYRDGLEQLVAQRTAALAEANRALEAEILHRTRVESDLAAARRKLQADREQQRLHLAGELHDSLGQELIGLKFNLEQLKARSKGSLGAEPARILAAAVEKCMALIREVRTICHGLYPPGLESFGLVSALQQLAEPGLSPIPVTLTAADGLEGARFPGEVEIALFRIAQEALQNALKHSRATRVDMRLWVQDGHVRLSVTDDGPGFDPDAAMGKGLGLISMRERTRTCGGDFSVISGGGRTCIEASCPVEPPPDKA